MKIFLDTANVADIEWAVRTGLIDGVTTNPSLIAREGEEGEEIEMRAHLARICRLVDGPVSAEVVAVDAEEMYREGRELAKIADNIVVKIPMIEEGVVAIRRLALDGIHVNTTLVFSAAQALLAAKAGATFVSPFVGRLDDIGHDGLTVVRDIRQIFDNYQVECGLLAASLRDPIHFVECAKAGVDAATLPSAVLKSLLLHPLTDRGLDQFLADWSKRRPKARAGG
jgi:transaldolase